MAERPNDADSKRAEMLIVAAGDAVPKVGQMCSIVFRDPVGNLHVFTQMEVTDFYATSIGGAEHIAIAVRYQQAEGISFSRIIRNMMNGGKGVQWQVDATSNRAEFKGKPQSWIASNVSYKARTA